MTDPFLSDLDMQKYREKKQKEHFSEAYQKKVRASKAYFQTHREHISELTELIFALQTDFQALVKEHNKLKKLQIVTAKALVSLRESINNKKENI